MTFKKINAFLHLWLGLGSGLIVFIVSITGCIYVFEKEIRSLYEPWQFVKPRQEAFLFPTQLTALATPKMGGLKPNSIRYGQKDEAVTVSNFNRKKGVSVVVFMNPYTGELIHTEKKNRKSNPDFFRFILNGHRALWLPYPVGRPIVGAAVLIFVLLLVSGIILWWPKKWIKSIRDKSFKIKWNASFKRKNYDLHNVLGFYTFLFLLLISLTGLVYSYKWYSKSLYWLSSGGQPLKEFKRALSDTTATGTFKPTDVDRLYSRIVASDRTENILVSLPEKASDAIGFVVYLKAGTLYKTNRYNFDQLSLKPITDGSPFSGRYEDASAADKLRRMNYDLHIGAILGIPTKILAFLASLISASLPVTGFIIWYNRKFKKKKKGGNAPALPRKKGEEHKAPKIKQLEALEV
ncbi:peptidase [Pedobacter sp. KBW06]|uniref:PepSY-associated TM helix domain-containing protein n=1 Tax=Pedobacter sp. KBW06 TaxID=2153359 RepID=UPI000F5B5614|nr:PepSY-associated TM helix domain-containing protein [Pedobacter sp. KBW06]RQO74102.1 peptidase [Pedobacter sp. KBW06]